MKLQDIKKIGPKTITLLNKINIYDVLDLVNYYPYRYNIYKPLDLNKANLDEVITINAIIESNPRVSYVKRNLNILRFKVMSSNLLINAVIYNRAYLQTYLDVGKKITLIGKYNKIKNTFTVNEIKFNWILKVKIEPVYHLIKGLKNISLHSFINEALNSDLKPVDYIPLEIISKYDFLDKNTALNIIHNPSNINELKQAKLRLIYEEFFVFMLKINFLKQKQNQSSGLEREFKDKDINEFINNLPFKLTSDQVKALDDIINDFKSHKRMNRLIQGDTGSGKTIVAIVTMYINYLCGYQSALMAPTEILASQHYENIKELLKNYDINVSLLVGSQSKKEHQKVVEDLKNGNVDMIIGTHALLSEDAQFKNLGLVITDEQHRFGVNQRNNLQNKGIKPDIIYMSATPIPRTYALTIYQDMDTSIIKTKPCGRKEIKTYVKREKDIKSVLEKMLEEIKNGHQIYVVSPAIESEEESNLKDLETLKQSFEKAFNNKVPIGILHGKLKAKEKDLIMDSFIQNKIKILISTTVIEVGVDVKNATMIVIFNAEMFGLATLHQLRGRVGRNEFDSYCYLISNKDSKRLKILEESNDGFYISEQDFLIRKSGDLFGTRQSGDMSFKLGDIKRDYKILLKAKEDCEEFLGKENNASKYKKLLRNTFSIY